MLLQNHPRILLNDRLVQVWEKKVMNEVHGDLQTREILIDRSHIDGCFLLNLIVGSNYQLVVEAVMVVQCLAEYETVFVIVHVTANMMRMFCEDERLD